MGTTHLTMKLFLATVLALVIQSHTKKSYEGYQVLRTSPLTPETSAVLRDVQMSSNRLDFWSDPLPGRPTDINTPPELVDGLKQMLDSNGVKYTTMIEDLEKLIEDTRPGQNITVTAKSGDKRYAMDWNDYHDHDTLNEFIAALADANDFAKIIPIGKSYEGRDMNILAIEKAGPGAPNVFLEAGIHPYSQLWLWPYGYAYDAYPDNWQEIKQLAEDAIDALYQVHGTIFDPINSAELYPAAGASDDWYKSIGMRFVFTTELRDTGRYGFVLPPEQIIPSGEEMWAGFETVVNKVLADME